MLHKMIGLLIEKYGLDDVLDAVITHEEEASKHVTYHVDALANSMGGGLSKINRIQAARGYVFGGKEGSLRAAKDWVEGMYHLNGAGHPKKL